MPDKQEYMEKAEAYFYKTYNRFPVVFERGEGAYLYDTEGQKYLDFGAGIAVAGLGYNDPEFNEALQSQAGKLLHTSNLFYNLPSIEAGERILKASGMEKVFFTNSGTEAIEGALKVARRHGYNQDPGGKQEIIAMEHSFHGRSLGALSVTGNDHYQEPFKPLIPGIRFAKFNDLDSVKALISSKTCGVILETIQGEGGIYPVDPEFLKGVKALCEKYNALLILDEIQCGMGRSGSMFAWQCYGVKPDIMTVAKALGNGVPIGAFLTSKTASTAMVPGDHGTTYGGNPFVTAAAAKVLELFEKRGIVEHAKEMGEYLTEKLDTLAGKYGCIKERRGVGLIQGLEFHAAVAPLIKEALLERKLILIGAGANVIRFVPPLVIEKSHIDEMAEKLEAVLCRA